MDEQIPQQNQAVPTPPAAAISALQKDVMLSAAIGLLCAVFIFPIAQNLEMKQSLAWILVFALPILAALGMRAAYWMAQKIEVFYQIAKFVLVGALNTLVDWGILNLLMFLTSITSGYMFSGFKGLSFLAAMANSYIWNKSWTFKKVDETVKSGTKEILQFFIVSLIGFALNVGVATLLVNVWGPHWGMGAALWANVGALAGTLLGLVWNFLGYKLIVFKN